MRRPPIPPALVVFGFLLALVMPAGPARASVPVLVVEGRGFGHGVGMAQDGALWMGRAGASAEQILGHFYPGTQFATASGQVRVAVLTPATGAAVVSIPGGGEIRSPVAGRQHSGFPVKVPPGGVVQVRFDGARYYAEPAPGGGGGASAAGARQVPTVPAQSSTTTTSSLLPVPTSSSSTLPPPPGDTSTTTTTAPPPDAPPGGGGGGGGGGSGGGSASPSPPSSPAPLWVVPADFGTVAVPARGAWYRGMVEATARGPGGEPAAFRLVNQVDVEDYLRGMGEVRDPSWPASGLQAQTIAARTYALRAMSASGELCDTQKCQVYLGQQAEYPEMDRAVAETRGVVLSFEGRLASAVYSANAGGVSATPEEGFGTSGAGYPYLRSARYETRDPAPWRIDVALSDIAARFGYRGTLERVSVTGRGPSERAVQVALEGSAGPSLVTGIDLAEQLSLRSTLFDTRIEVAESAPEPPPPAADGGVGLQVLPESVDEVTGTARWPGESAVVRERAAAESEAGNSRENGAPRWTWVVVLAAIALAGGYGGLTLAGEERRVGRDGARPETDRAP